MEKHHKLIIAFCLTVSALCLGFILYSNRERPKETSSYTQEVFLPVTKDNSYSPPVVKADELLETMVGSPDGKLSLKMREEKGETDTTYSFMIMDLVKGSEKEIFWKKVPLGTTLSIPLNTFSPDDKYIFLKETGEGGIGYLLLSASGTPLDKDALTLEISGLFLDKYPDYIITDVTGWGGVNLIVINTDKSDGGTGPSFWFDVSSHSFIQLSTRFD